MSLLEEMVQLGRGLRTPYGSHLSAPPDLPSRRLVMQREGRRTRASVLSGVGCMLVKESADALDRGRQNAVQ